MYINPFAAGVLVTIGAEAIAIIIAAFICGSKKNKED